MKMNIFYGGHSYFRVKHLRTMLAIALAIVTSHLIPNFNLDGYNGITGIVFFFSVNKALQVFFAKLAFPLYYDKNIHIPSGIRITLVLLAAIYGWFHPLPSNIILGLVVFWLTISLIFLFKVEIKPSKIRKISVEEVVLSLGVVFFGFLYPGREYQNDYLYVLHSI